MACMRPWPFGEPRVTLLCVVSFSRLKLFQKLHEAVGPEFPCQGINSCLLYLIQCHFSYFCVHVRFTSFNQVNGFITWFGLGN
jgi:hypothetical protein